MTPQGSLRSSTMTALFWSFVQSWGSRVVSTVFFIALARVLDPRDFGIASSSFLVLTLLNLVAEFGLGEALIQREGLKREDVNLPFFVAMGVSITLALGIILVAPQISDFMGVEGLAPYLRAAALIGPLVTLTALQEALYRRELRYRPLALRTLVAALLGGLVGLVMALRGLGAWSLIGQFATQALAGVLWLWLRPVWTPTLAIHRGSARQLGTFGLNIFSSYIFDFATGKCVEIIILWSGGPTALGFFTVASRLYMLLLQLLQASISGVAIAALSRIKNDLPRVQRLYIRGASVAAMFGTPIFFGLAALAPEVNHIMFGQKWIGAEKLMTPLLLMGGIHAVQNLNLAYLSALGRPKAISRLGLLRLFLVVVPLYFWPSREISDIVWVYVTALLLIAPLNFGATLRATRLSWASLALPVGLPLLAAFLGYCAVALARASGWLAGTNPLVSAMGFGALFALAFAGATAVLAFRVGRDNVSFLLNTARR